MLVTDGHLNWVLWVTLDSKLSEFMGFGNIVPAGLEVRGNTVYMAEALNMPTSFQIIGNTAYFVSLAGKVWAIDNVGSAPFGRAVR